MRIFYSFWFVCCAAWGYLLATFFAEPGESLAAVLLAFPIAVLTIGMMAFHSLRQSSIPAQHARLSIDIKPWQRPFGGMQFGFLTFLFSGVWGVGLALSMSNGHMYYPCGVLAMASGGLAGLVLACRVYRAGTA